MLIIKRLCCLILGSSWGLLYAVSGLQLNEILFQSAFPSRPVMIELKNVSSETIDAGGYTLADAYGNFFSLPEKVNIAPGDLLVVVFADGDREMLYLEPAAALNTSTQWIFCNDANICCRIFQEKRAQKCLLYSSSTILPDKLLDQICWGNVRYFKTLLPGDKSTPDVNTIIYNPGERGVPLDYSLAAFNNASGSRKWQTTGENTLGAMNPPPPTYPMPCPPAVEVGSPEPVPDHPVAIDPLNKLSLPGISGMGYQLATFGWRCKFVKGSFFRLQISRDPDFLTMAREEELTALSDDYVCFQTFELESGRYYWRVRREHDGQLGTWSPVYSKLIVQRD